MTSVYDLKGDEELTLEQKAEIVISTDIRRPHLKIDVENEVLEEDGATKYIFINNRKFGCSMQWRSRKDGSKFQEAVEDRNLQVAEDWNIIPMTACRCCKKDNVEKYEEKFFEHHWDFDTLFCYSNGYCKECAEKKAGIVHPTPEVIKEDFIREAKYEVGGESFTFRTDKDGFVWYWKNQKHKKNSSNEL